jgi:thiol-disulfide isomerase/thioredoxin
MIFIVKRFFVPVIIFLTFTTLISCKMLQTHKDPRGTHTREILNDSNQCPWFAPDYASYTPNADTMAKINTKQYADGYEILVFGGTWCGDTRYLLPKFYKTYDAIQSKPKVTFVLVDRDKESGEGIEKQYNIERVPTFIVLKEGKEVGRIVESVANTIEDDLLSILVSN